MSGAVVKCLHATRDAVERAYDGKAAKSIRLTEDLWRLREAQHDESSVNRKPSNTRLRATYRDVDGGHVKAHSRRRVDVIVTHGAATRSFVKGHRTILAVYEFSADPVTLGIAAVPPWALRTFPTEHF